jgi:hypothetical protein
VFVIAYANDPNQVIMDDSTMIRAAYITLDDWVQRLDHLFWRQLDTNFTN